MLDSARKQEIPKGGDWAPFLLLDTPSGGVVAPILLDRPVEAYLFGLTRRLKATHACTISSVWAARQRERGPKLRPGDASRQQSKEMVVAVLVSDGGDTVEMHTARIYRPKTGGPRLWPWEQAEAALEGRMVDPLKAALAR